MEEQNKGTTDKFGLRTIHSLLGENFIVPSYQRGYRWTKRQVTDLLQDIWQFASSKETSGTFYCLQPLVVQKSDKTDEGWIVIDGQQRLTTIYIIIRYLLKDKYNSELYSIAYETRDDSREFLNDITISKPQKSKENIDYYYMSSAYECVQEWFESLKDVKDTNDQKLFLSCVLGKNEDDQSGNSVCSAPRSVQFIWYMTDEGDRGLKLFQRLNMGKIPLTNAELIKALFLSENSFPKDDEAEIKKKEISLLWDKMEQQLSDADFWAFITNTPETEYVNKIELILDVYTKKSSKTADPFYTFNSIVEKRDKKRDEKENKKEQGLWDIWMEIENYYEILLFWYREPELYHKIGFLIASGYELHSLVSEALGAQKDKFLRNLNKIIRNYFAKYEYIEDLSYEDDYVEITNILLLFNVITHLNSAQHDRYPFAEHKGKAWSLEHIHAQNSEELKTESDWRNWLVYQKSAILSSDLDDRNVDDIDALLNKNIIKTEFDALAKTTSERFRTNIVGDEMHKIGNLALLGKDDNSALNNSLFAAKRNIIIEMDKHGDYIPVCTRHVFLKYYTDPKKTTTACIWNQQDGEYYVQAIKDTLEKCFPNEVND